MGINFQRANQSDTIEIAVLMEEIEVIFHGGAGNEAVCSLANGDPLLPAPPVDLGRFEIGICIPQAGDGKPEEAAAGRFVFPVLPEPLQDLCQDVFREIHIFFVFDQPLQGGDNASFAIGEKGDPDGGINQDHRTCSFASLPDRLPSGVSLSNGESPFFLSSGSTPAKHSSQALFLSSAPYNECPFR